MTKIYLIFITLIFLSCLKEFDYPQTIQVAGKVTYQADGLPVDSAMVQMYRYIWELNGDESNFQSYPYVDDIAQTLTNDAGEYKIVYALKQYEYCFGDIFGNIRTYKAGYLHDDWLKVKVYCTEESQKINFQIY